MRKILFISLLLANFISLAQMQNGQITIKPSATQGKDAQVYSIGNTTNYGNVVNLLLNTWTNQSVLGSIRFFLEFDLSSLPANAIIDSAYLKLYYDSLNSVNYRTHMGQNDMEVKRVSSPWNENTITWNNQPATSATNVLTIPPFTNPTQNYIINVSLLVQDIISTQNYGFMFKMLDESNFGRASIFASSDHPDSTLHPELTISYSLPTSIEATNVDLSNKITIYPNPSNGIYNFKFANEYKLTDYTIEIRNITGKIQDISPSDSQVDLSSLPKGIYFIRLVNKSNETYLKKIALF